MKRFSKSAIAVLAAATLAVIVYYATRPEEPMYQGMPLSEWLEALPPETGTSVNGVAYWSSRKAESPAEREAEQALKQMGTNVTACLLRRFDGTGVPGKDTAVLWLRKQSLVAVTARTSEDQRMEAMAAWRAQGTNSLPTLIRLMRHPEAQVRFNAIFALTDWPCFTSREFWVSSKPAALTSALIDALRDPDATVRLTSIHCLRFIGNQDFTLTIPALISTLADSDGKVGSAAATTLKEQLKNLSGELRGQAENALARIGNAGSPQ